MAPDAWSFLFGLGRFGVLLFFFHTSFVLMQSLDVSRGAYWALRFYVRRAFRIYPLALLFVALAVASGMPSAPWNPPEAPDHRFFTVTVNCLLVQNLFDRPSIVAPMWSLPIEVQMYIVLPLIFRLFDHRNWRMRAALVAGAGMALAGGVFATRHRVFNSGLHLGLLVYVPWFVAGALAYRLTLERKQTPPWYAWIWGALVLAVVIVGVSAGTLVAEWALCGLLAVLFPRFRDLAPGWLSTICKAIAKYSYGIYLSHPFAFWIAFTLIGDRVHSTLFRGVVCAALTVLSSVVVFHALEEPLINVGKRLALRLEQRGVTAGRDTEIASAASSPG